ncbi:Fe-S-cluster containining protein [Lachnospiraceae bacterium PH1-22]
MNRNDLCFCGSGKKYKKCHMPIKEKSKLAKMHKVNMEYDDYVEANGLKGKCLEKCNVCCSDYFYVSELEFLLILERLLSKGISCVDDYIDKARKYENEFKVKFPKEYEKLDKVMPPVDNYSNEYFYDGDISNTGLGCVCLGEDGLCEIYENRPVVCRLYGTMQKCEYIGNVDISPEIREHYVVSNIVVNKEGSGPMLQRPYPLFYWFTFFMEEPYRQAIINKALKLGELSESEYYDLKMSAQGL